MPVILHFLALLLVAELPSADLLAQARSASAAGDHAAAAVCYDRLHEQGFANGLLFLNQGNAHFLAGHLPEAVLAYRRAERYLPNHPALRANLEEARRQVLDAPAAPTPWLSELPFWPSRATRVLLALALWVLGWSLAAGIPIRPSRTLSVCAAGALVLALAFAASVSLAERNERLRPLAIVAVDGVILRQGNGTSYAAVTNGELPVVLNRGVELHVLQERKNQWARVRLADGRTGWVPASQLLIDRSFPDVMADSW